MTEASEIVFNPFAPGFTDNPYPQYAELRIAAPVSEHPLGFWLLTRYKDVHDLVLSDESVELSNLGSNRYRSMLEQLYGAAVTPRMGGRAMMDQDDPDHLRLRKLVVKAFTPRAVAAIGPSITKLVNDKLDSIADAGDADIVRDLAFPLPFDVISEMLGMPATDHLRVRDLANILAQSLEPGITPDAMRAIQAADEELAGIVREVLAWKRNNPADDLMSALIAAEDNGDVLDDDELVSQVLLMYLAGFHNTVNLISNGVHALLCNREQMALLRSRPDLDENAIEEILRFDAPGQLNRRVTVRDYRIGDIEIPAGAFVLASVASANRDAEFWGPDADLLRLDRKNAKAHLSFSAGPRFCLGAALARMEARIAIGGLIRRFDALEPSGKMEWNGRINLRGPATLPVSVK
ncbi:cytochrome P450 [Nocardia sp. NPDC059091]|uniref:cytochrome P450 n=1 Tax=unclassified Nocardia TaxID=2637762 RepID=UPI00369AF3EE